MVDEPGERLDRLAHEAIGAAIEVHRHLGPGCLESTYEEALAIELELREIPFEKQVSVSVSYKGRELGKSRLDFLIGGELNLELKAVDTLVSIHHAQLMAYLKATDLQLGLLINFNVPILKDGIRRIVRS